MTVRTWQPFRIPSRGASVCAQLPPIGCVSPLPAPPRAWASRAYHARIEVPSARIEVPSVLTLVAGDARASDHRGRITAVSSSAGQSEWRQRARSERSAVRHAPLTGATRSRWCCRAGVRAWGTRRRSAGEQWMSSSRPRSSQMGSLCSPAPGLLPAEPANRHRARRLPSPESRSRRSACQGSRVGRSGYIFFAGSALRSAPAAGV